MGRASSPASLPRIRGSLFNSRSQPRFDNSNLGWWRLREWRGPNRDRWCDRRLNGKPVFIEFVSPKQLNILIPADTLPGPAQLQLISNGLTSATMTVQVQALAQCHLLCKTKLGSAAVLGVETAVFAGQNKRNGLCFDE
ncbi:MAG: hypothetical protein DMG57_39565 [Acidobacteria bacterium]|nr:MAG: hypothetical protein DMG57_39565 [Acidobacteriota bacterium]